MPKLDEQISTLQQKLTQLKLRQQRVEARQRAINALRERKAETRRKILVGDLVLDKMRQGAIDAAMITAWLDQSLKRAADRVLFGLTPLTSAPTSQGAVPETHGAESLPE